MTPYIFQRGETIAIALDALSGDPLLVTQVDAKMKALAPGRSSADNNAPITASFVASARAASIDHPAGWTLTIPAATSALLSPGTYIADAKLQMAAGVIVTDPVAITIKGSIST